MSKQGILVVAALAAAGWFFMGGGGFGGGDRRDSMDGHSFYLQQARERASALAEQHRLSREAAMRRFQDEMKFLP